MTLYGKCNRQQPNILNNKIICAGNFEHTSINKTTLMAKARTAPLAQGKGQGMKAGKKMVGGKY